MRRLLRRDLLFFFLLLPAAQPAPFFRLSFFSSSFLLFTFLGALLAQG
jgi:hypothetical protein|tara:strand:- start:602 stop:745 length:144 start_codon:yes stop_codon:yes gene_type:complete